MSNLLQNYLTSGHSFEEHEYQLRSKFILFNGMMALLTLQIFLLVPYRFYAGSTSQAIADSVFLILTVIALFVLRINVQYHRFILPMVWFSGFSLIIALYINIPHIMVGGSWFAIALLPAFFLLGPRAGFLSMLLAVLALLVATHYLYPDQFTLLELLEGIIPIIMTALFINFYESRVNSIEKLWIKRTHLLEYEVERQTEKRTKEIYDNLKALERSEALLNRTQQVGHVGSWELDLHSGTITFSQETYRLLGVDSEMFLPSISTVLDALNAHDRFNAIRNVMKCIKTQSVQTQNHRIYHSDGSFLFAKSYYDIELDADDKPFKIIGSTIDLSEQHEIQQELQFKKRMLTQLNSDLTEYQELINDYVPIVTIDPKGTIITFNKAFSDLTQYTLLEVRGKNLAIFNTESAQIENFMNEWQQISKDTAFENSCERTRKDGSKFWIEYKVRPQYSDDQMLIGYRMIWHDITSEKKLEYIATVDPLTKAFNRTKFNDLITGEVNRFERYNTAASLIICDLDHFKEVNDTYGHLVGDTVLKTVATIIQSNIRNTDYLARWGGEEFAILLPNTVLEEAQIVAHKIHHAVRSTQIQSVGGLTISCGISEIHSNDTVTSWFKRVDDLLFTAKNSGRDQVQIA